MGFNIKKAAVIGSGTMGGGIAALLAGAGIETCAFGYPARRYPARRWHRARVTQSWRVT